MSRAQVPRSAIDASLWFVLGRSLTAEGSQTQQAQTAKAAALDADVVEVVSRMLSEQGAAQLTETVLSTIRAGREHLAHDAALTLSAKRYDELRAEFIDQHMLDGGKGRTLWPVGSTTALKRAGGSWNAALSQAGLATSAKPQAAGFGKARFSAEQFQAAIRDFNAACEDAGSAPTYQAYGQWQRGQKQQGRSDRPSGAAIRNTYGSWKAALASDGTQG